MSDMITDLLQEWLWTWSIQSEFQIGARNPTFIIVDQSKTPADYYKDYLFLFLEMGARKREFKNTFVWSCYECYRKVFFPPVQAKKS